MLYYSRMKYIVVHDKPGTAGVTIEPEGRLYKYQIKCWALNSGKRVEFGLRGLQSVLKQYYVSGRFETFAWYALSYDELCHIVRGRIGPSDDEVYYELINQPAPKRVKQPWLTEDRVVVGITAFTHIWMGLLHAFLLMIKFMLNMLLLPMIISFFKKK